MELQHVNIKVFVKGELPVEPEEFVPVFHGWVQEQAGDTVLIDVADYCHVPNGPGVMLIGLEEDLSLDNAGGRWGLLYNRKGALDGGNTDRIRAALRRTVAACLKLEDCFSDAGLRFGWDGFDIIINDRALAPNTPETWEAARPEIEAGLQSALGHDGFTLEHHSDPRSRFRVSVRCTEPADFDRLALAGS